MSPTSWYIKADYLENCNCDLLCPCLFAVKPTHGDCAVPTSLWHAACAASSVITAMPGIMPARTAITSLSSKAARSASWARVQVDLEAARAAVQCRKGEHLYGL
jgi:phage-related tail fiber protein